MRRQRIKWLSIVLVMILVMTGIPQMSMPILVNAQEIDERDSVSEDSETLDEVWESECVPESIESEILETEIVDETIVSLVEEEETTDKSTELFLSDDENAGETTELEVVEECTQESEMAESEEVTFASDFDMSSKELIGIQPTVLVKEAYDLYLSLTLGVPEDAVLPKVGDLYYLVKITTYKSCGNKPVVSEHFVKKHNALSQDVTIQMENGLISEGQEWTYDIEASLVYTMLTEADTVGDIKSSALGRSSVCILRDVEATAYYESKLTLKEGTKKIFTTQQDVAIATVKFSKKTTERDNLKVEDVTYASESNKQYALELREIGEDLVVYASADEDTALGKHKIKVTASAPADMYASEAFITVNVVQGIEDGMLSVVTPSDVLYKAENKAASLTFKVQYGKDSDTLKDPDKKKVTWEVLAPDQTAFAEGGPLSGMISIKNGVVNVKKKYILSENAEENRFIVKVSAVDFADNTVFVYTEVVEIMAQAEELGEVVIMKADDSGNYRITGRSETIITSDMLGYVRVFKADAPVLESYTTEELEQWTFAPQYLTYKSNNSAVKIANDGFITVSKPVKNVKITVVANDKSNHKAELKKLTIAYAQPAELGLKVELVDREGNVEPVGDIHAHDTNIAVESLADSRYLVTVMQREDGEWEPVNSYVNFNLTVTSGKIIRKSGAAKQIYLVSSTKEKMTIKLTDKAKKSSIIYTITNTTFPKGTSPKLTTKDVLKARSYASEQSITYEIKKNGKFSYDYAGKIALITVDNAEKYKSESNEARYEAFEQVADGLGYQSVDTGTVVLRFETEADMPLPAGNYKLWFTFGTMDENGDFIADTAAKAVNLRANKVQVEKGTYTPVTAYKMAIKEGGKVKLTGNGKRFLKDSIVFSNLRNANVNGGPNAFRTYYELTENTLKLKDDLTETELSYITSASAQKDWACHLDYSVLVSNTDGSYSEKTGTIKVKITMCDSVRKFTFNTVNAPDDETVVNVNAYANNKKVNISHAYATAGSYTATCDGTSKLVLTPKTGDVKPKGGENNVTIYVVPEGTYQANKDKLDSLKAAWENARESDKSTAEKTYVSAMKKYGIKATAKVVLPSRMVENRELAEEVVKLVNVERAKIGLKPLSINDDVMYASYVRAQEISTHFSHTRPNGSSCFTVLKEYGIPYGWAGENIAYGYPTPESVMNGWMNSSGHRANILFSNFTEIGVGCYEYNGRLYWVQLFIG